MAGESIDKVVLELEARAGKFRVDMEGSATVTEKALVRIENSASRMERQVGRSFANTAQQSRLLGYQISDIGVQLSAGTSPFLVLAQQGPQVANALEGARGAVGRFATFLSGPYGAAVLAATTLLGVWLSKTKEAADTVDDLVEKMKAQERQAVLTEQANALFARTIEGVTKAADDAEKAVEALRLAKKGEAEQTVESIQKNLNEAEALREVTRARLADARALYEIQKQRASGPGETGDRAALGLSSRLDTIRAIEAELAKADAQAQRLRNSLGQAISARTVEQENASAEEKINRKYDAQIDRAARAANASKAAQAELRKEIKEINAAREAELKRYQDSQRAARSSPSSGASGARVGDMVALIKQLFPEARITSTTGGKHTKGSDHYAGRAIDFVIPGMMNEAGTQLVRQMLQAAGVEIRRNASGKEQFFGPGRGARTRNDHNDHFHVAWNGNPSTEGAQRAADSEERRRQSFENELAAAMAEELAARRSLVTSAEAIDKANLEAIEIERQRYNDNLDSLVTQRKLRSDEADALRLINDETAKYKAELIKRNADIRAFRLAEAQRERDAQIGSAQRADEADLLQGRADLARTLDERNAIELRLLDLKYEEERAQNDFVIAAAARLKTEYEAGRVAKEVLDAAQDAARIAGLRNASIGARRGADAEMIGRNNPLDRYLDDVGDTKTRVEAAMVRQLQEVNDGISDSLSKELGIKSSFVRDLFSIFLDDAVFRPLAEALRNKGSGGGGLFGSIIGAVTGLFGGGGSASSSIGSGASSFNSRFAGARAGGGPTSANSIYRINENATPGNPEFFQSDVSGTVIPLGQVNARAAQPVTAQQGPIELRVYADRGAFISDVQAISQGEAVKVTLEAAPAIIDRAANETIRRSNRPRMPGAGR
jgi:hypothetical protein